MPLACFNIGYNLNFRFEEKLAKADGITLKAESNVAEYNGKSINLAESCFESGGKLYVPVASFAENVLGHKTFTDGNGLVVTSANDFKLSDAVKTPEYLIQAITEYPADEYSNAKILNWYMQFERPNKETLAADFDEKTEKGTMHPRICATKEDFDRIRTIQYSDSDYKKVVDAVISRADAYIGQPSLEYVIPDKQRLLVVANAAYQRTSNLGFAYQITGDKKYAEACKKLLNDITGFPDWNPSRLIDHATLLSAAAIGYDWIYDTLTKEEREYFVERVTELGLKDARNFHYNLLMIWDEWANAAECVDAKSNFNTVINSGRL